MHSTVHTRISRPQLPIIPKSGRSDLMYLGLMAHKLSSTHYLRNQVNINFGEQAHIGDNPDRFSFCSVTIKQELLGVWGVMMSQPLATCEGKRQWNRGHTCCWLTTAWSMIGNASRTMEVPMAGHQLDCVKILTQSYFNH